MKTLVLFFCLLLVIIGFFLFRKSLPEQPDTERGVESHLRRGLNQTEPEEL